MLSDTARLLARAMQPGKTVTIPASSLPENGSSYEPTEEEKLYRELLDDVKNRPPHLRIGLESVLPAKDQSPEDWARDMTQQIMARRAANEDKRNLWERFVDTSNFAASLPVRVATKGEYGLGDVLNDQGVSDAEARFAKANQGPLEAVSNLGELAGALPTWEGIGAIPKGILSNALRKAPKMPTASELSRTTFSGGIPEAKAAKIAATGEVQAPIDAAMAKIERRPTSNGFDIIVPSDIPSSPFAKANVTVNSSYNPADSTAYVSNVWVRDDLRRKGVATKLYDEIENMLKTDGKTLVPSNSLKRAGFDFWRNRAPEAVANDLRSHENAIGKWADQKYGPGIRLEYRDGGETVDVYKNGRSIDRIGRSELVDAGVFKLAPELAMDEASRMARAKEMGYSPDVFYRGESTGKRYEGGPAHFSRDYDVSSGHANKGGVSTEEYRLNLSNVFSDTKPIMARNYSNIVASAKGIDPSLAADLAETIAPGKGVDWVIEFGKRNPDMVVVDRGGTKFIRQAIERSGDPIGIFKGAGYDALDTGRDVRKISSEGIRSSRAAFDPNKSHLSDIMAGVAGMLGIPALTSTSRRD